MFSTSSLPLSHENKCLLNLNATFLTDVNACLNLKPEQTNESFGEELEADLLAEGEKLGPVEKITAFAKNSKGPVVIKVDGHTG